MLDSGVLAHRNLIWNFAQRDLKARFKGTLVGWGWSLILPIASLLTYTLVAHYILRAQPPPFGNGDKGVFAVWLFAGLTAWGYFSNAVNTGIGALLGTGGLLKKIYFPSYTPVLGAVIGVAIQSGIELGLVLIVVAAYGNVGWTWLLIPFWAAVFSVFVASMAVILGIANIYFRDLAHIVSVFLQLLFYATPILYPDTYITSHVGRGIIMSNPMSQFVDIFRELVYGLSSGSVWSWVYAVMWAGLAAGAAVVIYKRFGRDLSEEL